jgi:hypothetical protein
MVQFKSEEFMLPAFNGFNGVHNTQHAAWTQLSAPGPQDELVMVATCPYRATGGTWSVLQTKIKIGQDKIRHLLTVGGTIRQGITLGFPVTVIPQHQSQGGSIRFYICFVPHLGAYISRPHIVTSDPAFSGKLEVYFAPTSGP